VIRPRYAIYFAPEDDTELSRFGWSWMGREPYSTADVSFPPAVASDPAHHAAIIAEARIYGFHATLKPPFHLADGHRLDDLVNALHEFSATRRRFEIHPLQLGEIDGFLALRPSHAASDLDALAADCVRNFDRFRAPLSAADIARRTGHGLTPRQSELLHIWGYPYVLDEFRFHMTLTRRLDDAARARARTVLTPLVAAAVQERLQVHSVCLFEQLQPDSRFTLKVRIPLTD
jgi:putative phosphonate metabolism protein